MSSVVLVLMLVAATCTSCSPWFFTMQRDTDWPVFAKIISRHDLVDVDAANAFTATYPSRVALRCEEVTDGIFDTEVRTDAPVHDTSTILVLQLRSTPYADTVRLARCPVEIRISSQHTTVITPDTTSVVAAPLPRTGAPFRIQIVTFGRAMRVSVACHDVGIYSVTDAQSEWVTVVPGIDQTIHVIDPVLLPVGYVDRWQTR